MSCEGKSLEEVTQAILDNRDAVNTFVFEGLGHPLSLHAAFGLGNENVDRTWYVGMKNCVAPAPEVECIVHNVIYLEIVGLVGDVRTLQLPPMPDLQFLCVKECLNLESVACPGSMPELDVLKVTDCPRLHTLVGEVQPALSTLHVKDCPSLTLLMGPGCYPALNVLELEGCSGLGVDTFPDVRCLSSLIGVNVRDVPAEAWTGKLPERAGVKRSPRAWSM